MPDLHLLICCSITGSLRRLSWDLYLILSHLNMPEQLTSAAVSKLQLSCRVHHTVLVENALCMLLVTTGPPGAYRPAASSECIAAAVCLDSASPPRYTSSILGFRLLQTLKLQCKDSSRRKNKMRGPLPASAAREVDAYHSPSLECAGSWLACMYGCRSCWPPGR